MKKILVTIILLSSMTAIVAQEKVVNDKNAQKRSVQGFHGIKVSHGIDLFLSQGNTETVVVSASDESLRDRIKTVVENGVLKIYLDNKDEWWKFNWSSRNLRAYVSVKNIDLLDASGGSDVDVDGTLKSAKLAMEISGGSDFKGKVDIGDLSIDQSGGSDIDISGRAGKLDITSSGGSDFDGYDLVSDVCTVDASGGSDVNITANRELIASASGGSDVHYRGNAELKKKNSSGGSSVSKRD
jgi:Putative auto-transporter adhesin, head GIN domain